MALTDVGLQKLTTFSSFCNAVLVIWLLVAFDLAAGGYLLGWAARRPQRDKDGVLAVGVVLLVCAALLAGLAGWQLTQDEPARLPPSQSVSVT